MTFNRHPCTDRPRRAILPRVTVLAAVLAVLFGAGTGTAMALLSVSVVTSSRTVAAGDLRISVGEMTWEQTTPGVESGASGVLADSPTDFESMPGDVIEIRVPLTTFLWGDNLVADMTIDCSSTAVSEDVSAVFHIEDETGGQVAPGNGKAQVDEPLTVHGLVGGDAGTTEHFEVVIRVEVLGAYRWVTPESTEAPVTWSVGTIHAGLEQVRSGAPE